MSDNRIRTHLIMKLVCASCGGLLRMSYDMPKAAALAHSEGEPTGAAKVQSLIAVEPCQACMQPAREVSDALATIMKHAAKEHQ
jgi:hypothetical protein